MRDNSLNRTCSQECSNNIVRNHTRDQMLATSKTTFKIEHLGQTNLMIMMMSTLRNLPNRDIKIITQMNRTKCQEIKPLHEITTVFQMTIVRIITNLEVHKVPKINNSIQTANQSY